MTKKNIVILASGEGTNAENIIRHFSSSPMARVAAVFSNRRDAKVLLRAQRLFIPTEVFNRGQFYETGEVITLLKRYEADLIVLAGFLWLVPDSLIKEFPQRIVNIHPALLPSHGGKGMYGRFVHEAVIAARDVKSGITVHFVDEQYDEGEIISQHSCEVTANDTAESLAQKIHELEQKFFPAAIEKALQGLPAGTPTK
jgi:phosphoribosylglycinamide formyltransferase-1